VGASEKGVPRRDLGRFKKQQDALHLDVRAVRARCVRQGNPHAQAAAVPSPAHALHAPRLSHASHPFQMDVGENPTREGWAGKKGPRGQALGQGGPAPWRIREVDAAECRGMT
jgi:hypothetical protein